MHTMNTPAGMKLFDVLELRLQRTFGMGKITREQFDQVLALIKEIRVVLNISKHNKAKTEVM